MPNTLACKFLPEEKSQITSDINEDPSTNRICRLMHDTIQYPGSGDLIGIFIILAFNAPLLVARYFIRVISQGAAVSIRLLAFFSPLSATNVKSAFAIGVVASAVVSRGIRAKRFQHRVFRKCQIKKCHQDSIAFGAVFHPASPGFSDSS